MIAMKFNSHGYRFQSGIKILKASFEAGSAALRNEADKVERAAQDYEDKVKADPNEWIGEMDEGHVLWDQSQIYDMQIENSYDALMELRKAYAITIFHHWERWALLWTGSEDGKHDDLVADTKQHGYPVHHLLERARYLSNTLKHDSAKFGPRLFNAWPDLFPAMRHPKPPFSSWYDLIHLTDDHISELCDVIAQSGPTATQPSIKPKD